MIQHSNYWFSTYQQQCRLSTGIIKKADIVIVGGGLSGITLLFKLLSISPKLNIYLLEDGLIGTRTSGRLSGQIFYGDPILLSTLSNTNLDKYLYYVQCNNKAQEEFILSNKIDCSFIKSGGIKLAKSEAEMEIYDSISKHFSHCQLFDGNEITAIIPSKSFFGGLYMPMESVINPYQYINNLADYTEQLGRRILTNACVDSVVFDGKKINISVKNRGVIVTDQIVYCTNTNTPYLVPDFKPNTVFNKNYIMMTQELPESICSVFPDFSLSCELDSLFFRLCNNRFLFGQVGNSVLRSYDGEINVSACQKLNKAVYTMFPCLSEADIENIWSYITYQTCDRMPLIGKVPNTDNAYILSGFNGYDFSYSYLGATAICDLLLKNKTSIDLSLFDPGRFENDS